MEIAEFAWGIDLSKTNRIINKFKKLIMFRVIVKILWERERH